MVFIKENIITLVKSAISQQFVNLNINDKEIIINYTLKILEIIYYLNNLDFEIFEIQLRQNNYKDIKWLFTLLLPYINDNSNIAELTRLKDIYTDKIVKGDINEKEPLYKYTNIQYGRCLQSEIDGQIIAKEIEFNIEHLEHNLYLLINTLLESSNKLYVNWIEILPLHLNEFIQSKLYQNTLKIYKEHKLADVNITEIMTQDIADNNRELISSLYIGDIYNCIKTYLYDEIKGIKLLIFDLVIIDNNLSNPIVPAISVLGEIFNTKTADVLNCALQDIRWDLLTDVHHKLFEEKFSQLSTAYINNTPFTVIVDDDNPQHTVKSYTVSQLSIQRLMKGIVINFDIRNRNNKNILKKGYKILKTELDDDVDDDKLDVLDLENLKECIKSINTELLYDFFRGILQQFKYTYYGTELLNENKTQIEICKVKDYTYKNIYNFSKSLTHYELKGEYLEYNKYWKSLEDFEKKEILKRLNDKYDNILSWFNIQGYIRFLKLADYDYTKHNTEYDTTLSGEHLEKFTKLVIGTGLRNQKYDNNDLLYNIIIYDKIREDLPEIIFKCLIQKGILSKLSFKSELTDSKYTKRENIQEKLKHDIFLQSESNNYYIKSYYYLNELPYKHSKLFEVNSADSWYGMAALEWVSQIGFCQHYINNRVCYMTGGTGVGKSTHVPKLYAYYLKAIDYKSNGITVCTQPRITPTIKTAKTVSEQLGLPIYNEESVEYLNNYFMQLQYKGKKHTRNSPHLIIKIVTDGLLFQEIKNLKPLFKKERTIKDKVKFGENLYDVIIVDEAHEHNRNMDMILTLMRLYVYYNPSIRLVILSATIDNDEPVYRRYYRIINDNLKFPFDINLKLNNIDRINVDRRYHISPPGATTRYPIKEIYHDETTNIIQLTQQIIRGAKGNILLFQSGQKDILNSIEQLNKVIPANWIALPFYSELNDKRRQFIEDLDIKFSKLHINKDENFNEITTLYDQSKPTYTNFVLVATNIAEASITINSLYYVIDIGKRKNDYYNYEKKNSKILETFISESSRLQRKGRVGRRQAGEVHYLYKENALLFNKTSVEFSIQNISESIYGLLREKSDEKEFKLDEFINDKFLGRIFKTSSGIYDYNGSLYTKDLFMDIPKYYEKGYELNELLDEKGTYYIIHPDDLEFKRNIIGKIIELTSNNVEYSNRDLGLIKSKKILSYVEDFIIYNYIEENNNKTDIGLLIQVINENFQFDNPSYGKILLNSILLNNDKDAAILVTALDVLRGDLKTLFIYDDENLYYRLEKTGTKLDSDFQYIINLLKDFINYINQKFNYTLLDKSAEEYIYKSTNYVNKHTLKSIITNYEHVDEEDLNREYIVQNMIEYIEYNITQREFQDYIIKWCKIYNVNHIKLIKFMLRYIKIVDHIQQLYFPDKKEKDYSEIILKNKKLYTKYLISSIDKLKLAFVLSLPYNICINITGTDQYLSLYNPTINNIYNLQKIRSYKDGKKIYRKETFINLMYIMGYVLYLNFKDETITGLIHIDKSYIKILNKIYNRTRLENHIRPYSLKIDKYLELAKMRTEKKIPKTADYNAINKVGAVYKTIINDLDS